jgi:hypothetical protein
LLLIEELNWREFGGTQGRVFALAIVALALFWAAHALASGRYTSGALLGFPDIGRRILWPWARAMPIMTCEILAAIGYWLFRAVAAPDTTRGSIAPLLALLLLLALAVAAIPTDRIETRYTFFLYPATIVLAVAALRELTQSLSMRNPHLQLLAVAAALLCFAAAEDFQPVHVAHIDSAAANFRIAMRSARADHYYPRNDMRGIGAWLRQNVRPGDVVLSGIPSLDQYYPAFDYFYLEEDDNRQDAYVCADGRTERWTNHPLLQSLAPLLPTLASGHRVYAIVYQDVEARLTAAAKASGWPLQRPFTAMDGKTRIIGIGPLGADGAVQ